MTLEGAANPTDLEVVPCAACGSPRSERARMVVPRDEMAQSLSLRDGRSAWVVCVDCGLVYQSPRPGARSVEAMYSEGGYHENRGGVPEHYVQYSLRRSRAALAWGLSYVDGPAGRALDIGCGIGGALVELRSRGWDVVGVEPDPNLAEVAVDRFQLEVRAEPLSSATFAGGESFDLAYSCHVWEHLADPADVTRVAHGLLRERRGHLLIVVPTFRRARTFAWVCFTAPHTYMFTDVTLGNILESSGFDVVASRYHAGADSELWILARAADREPVPPGLRRRDDPRRVQREIVTVPLRAPLGVPSRLAGHVKTLASDPRDFTARLSRWAGARRQQLRAARGRS
jgi:SAM-dependent methyltransferase